MSRQIRTLSIAFLGVVAVAILVSGCVPSPSDTSSEFPSYTLLSTFYTPQVSGTTFLWQDSSAKTGVATIRTQSFERLAKAPSFNSNLLFSVFLWKDTTTKKAVEKYDFISDSLVLDLIQVTDSLQSPVIRLHGVLTVGAKWVAADSFITANGAAVTISALVDDYYTSTVVGGMNIADVYHIVYRVEGTKTAAVPTDPQYQPGSTLEIYFAKSIGPTYYISKDPNGNVIWTRTLLETHTP